MGKYYNSVSNLLENISSTNFDLKEIIDWAQSISDILVGNSCSGELVSKISKHIEMTIEIANNILNKTKHAYEQIETNATNCDNVWNSCYVGRKNGTLTSDKEITDRKEITDGIELTIKEIIDVGYWSGSERTRTTTKTISEEDMVNGREFNF